MPTSRKNPVTAAEAHSAVEIVDTAPAKVNLTLRVLGRRPDGYHDIESLVAFADLSDRLFFAPDGKLALAVTGPGAGQTGEDAENLVLRPRAPSPRAYPALRLARFVCKRTSRSRQDWAADRPMRRRRFGSWRGLTGLRPPTRAFTRRPVPLAPTCRSVLIGARG